MSPTRNKLHSTQRAQPIDGFEGRIRLYLHDEAPRIGSGERGLTVSVEPKRVRLLNHHTGDVAWITRAVFEMLAEKQRGRLAPRDGWLVAPAVLSHASGPEALQLKLVVSNEPKDTRKEQAA